MAIARDKAVSGPYHYSGGEHTGGGVGSGHRRYLHILLPESLVRHLATSLRSPISSPLRPDLAHLTGTFKYLNVSQPIVAFLTLYCSSDWHSLLSLPPTKSLMSRLPVIGPRTWLLSFFDWLHGERSSRWLAVLIMASSASVRLR